MSHVPDQVASVHFKNWKLVPLLGTKFAIGTFFFSGQSFCQRKIFLDLSKRKLGPNMSKSSTCSKHVQAKVVKHKKKMVQIAVKKMIV